ncbi:MAG: carboxy terminal-processing peptidase [Kofleriaceae bacterium]
MHRYPTLAILGLVAACSASKRTSNEAPRPSPTTAQTELASTPAPDPRERVLTEAVVHLLEEQHLLHRRIDDNISRMAFETYLDQLDGGKMFLLRGDRDNLAKYADQIDDELHFGSLVLAHEGSKIFVKRVEVVDKMVSELLASPVDLTNEEWIELDPKKVELAADDAELRDRWRRRIELEVLERVAQMELQAEGKDKDHGEAKAPPSAKRKRVVPLAVEPKEPNPAPKSPPVDLRPDAPEGAPPVVGQIPATPEAREAKARADLLKSYSGRFARLRTPGPLDAAADLLNAVAATLDPHTTYLPPADKANFDIRMSGSLEGIGAVLRERDHYVEVSEIVPGGASWRHGGIAAGDLILSVAAEGAEPVDVLDMHIDDVVKMIRGPKGTVVRLRLQKPTGHQETVAIKRDVVVIEEAYARGAVLSRRGAPDIGYIHLPSFYGGSGGTRTASADVQRLLRALSARKVRGVILDIRSNGGGLLNDAVKLTGGVIDTGPVVQVRDGRGRSEVLEDEFPGTDFDGPMIVLVDRFSASASEILAGALQDYGRAVIVGTAPTHGKGTVQTLADLDRITGGSVELGVLKLTIQQFFRVSGASTQREGVTPDILLPDPAAHIESGERELPHAIAWSKIDEVAHARWSGTWDLAALRKSSAARVAKHPILAKIAAATAVLRARRDDTRVPLTRAAFDERREAQRRALDAASPDLKVVPPAFTVKLVGDQASAKPGPDGKADDSLSRWQDSLSRDPWVDECLAIAADLAR